MSGNQYKVTSHCECQKSFFEIHIRDIISMRIESENTRVGAKLVRVRGCGQLALKKLLAVSKFM